MYNKFDYEKRILRSSKDKSRKGYQNSRPGSGKNQKPKQKPPKRLPPVPGPPKINKEDFEKYLSNGGYYERILQKNAAETGQKSSRTSSKPGSKSGLRMGHGISGKKDKSIEGDFMTSLVKRVSHLERTLAGYRQELKIKTKLNYQLQEKLKFYEDCIFEEEIGEGNKNNKGTSTNLPHSYNQSEGQMSQQRIENDTKKAKIQKSSRKVFESVMKENQRLRSEIVKIQDFLSGYGIRWKNLDELDSKRLIGFGDIDEENFNVNQLALDMEKNNKKLKFKVNLPKEVDINIIGLRVSELNSVVLKEQGTKEMVSKGNGVFGLEAKKPKFLIFYKNGVHLEGFPLFAYGSKDAIGLISDILEGYFPRQLEKSYPEGVLLKLVDRLDHTQNEAAAKGKRGKGAGFSLADLQGAEDSVGLPMTKNEFLNKLPKRVISKDGKVVEVRSEVENTLNQAPKPAKKSINSGFSLIYHDRATNPSAQPGDSNQSKMTLKELIASPEDLITALKTCRRLSHISGSTFLLRNEISLQHSDTPLDKIDLVKNDLVYVKLRLEDTGVLLHYLQKKDAPVFDCLENCKKVFDYIASSEVDVDSLALVNNFPKTRLEVGNGVRQTYEDLDLCPRAALHLHVGS